MNECFAMILGIMVAIIESVIIVYAEKRARELHSSDVFVCSGEN